MNTTSERTDSLLFSNNLFFTSFLLPLLFTIFPVTLFYFLDQRLHLKRRLVGKFNSIRSYKVTLLVSCLTLYTLYMTHLYRTGSSLFFTGAAIIFLYQYLIYKPERCLPPKDSD